jgi:hypothetical protein
VTTSNVIDLADRRPAAPAASVDPVAAALAALPRTAGLATRVRAMIDAGASDVFLDVYVATWIESARDDLDANRDLHLELAKRLGALA